jgi:hypothetical protein
MNPLLKTAWAMGGLQLLLACSPPPAQDWFPLEVGPAQHYRVTFEGEDVSSTEHWTQTVARHDTFQGQRVAVREHSAGVAFYLVSDEAGVRRVAVKTDVDAEPQADEVPRWIIKAPYAVGTEWAAPSVPYLLRRRNEYPRELKNSHRVLMQWRIEAVDAEVSTPRGRFSPCLAVVGKGSLNLYTDPVNGFNDVPIVAREWYCKGHGLVRWERVETVPKGFFTGGSVVAEWEP